MLKKVMYDYKASFRWARLKEVWNVSMVWPYLHLMLLFPIMMGVNEGVDFGGGSYYLTMIPLLFGKLSLDMVPVRLPKQMFLCPIAKQERKQYVKLLFLVRLLAALMLAVISVFIAAVLRLMDLRVIGFQMIGYFTVMLCASVIKWTEGMKNTANLEQKYGKVNLNRIMSFSILGICLGAVLWLVLAYDIQDIYESKLFLIFFVVCFVAAVFSDLMVLREIDLLLEITIDYEVSYEVLLTEKNKRQNL